jgi:hypothetical protein
VTEAFNHLLDYRDIVHLVEFKGQCIDDMLLLVRHQRIVEELRLIVVLAEFDRTKTLLDSLNLLRVSITPEKPTWMLVMITTYSMGKFLKASA